MFGRNTKRCFTKEPMMDSKYFQKFVALNSVHIFPINRNVLTHFNLQLNPPPMGDSLHTTHTHVASSSLLYYYLLTPKRGGRPVHRALCVILNG